ncbi:hypothetical protein SAMN06265371_11334 [Lutibacter agarilyticus]|uniref:Type I restriction modification DNA specificity domain-containing protein n=1 Tax=Lutibacter agarilyticus TaxID=1109740 RepID=A0A238Z4J7_9FLAO|nr:hypothetical protein [Lutibacter agarilyticus]SNR78355.1 hypothetical protein SAMN06265371_11334 [Lutibacter agarilyticus]
MRDSAYNFNSGTMLTYEIKTHQPGRTYNKPHFFILNKGLNSGKPLDQPCPNCFVITTSSEQARESLYYLCLSLKIGRFFNYYLKGSVIPFICISDAKKVINTALQNNQEQQWKIKVEKLKKINAFEENLQQQLAVIKQLKIALLRS